MWKSISRMICLGILILGAPVRADDKPQPTAEGVALSAVAQDAPAFMIGAKLNHPSGRYVAGEEVALTLLCEEEAYLYVLYQQADGKTFQIFPNSAQGENLIPAKRSVRIPATDDFFRWTAAAPFGKESIKIFATKHPLESFEAKSLRAERFNPVSSSTWKGAVAEIESTQARQWAELELDLLTTDQAPEIATAKRIGVFFGVAEYQVEPVLQLVSNGESSMALPGCERDALGMSAVMRKAGKLDEVKAFVNQEATTINLKRAITEWLPSVSHPGDTVFIYFSGHGDQIVDDNDDESDGRDEYLMPYDFMNVHVLMAMSKLQREGKLPTSLLPRLKEGLKFAEQYDGDVAKIDQALTRATAVTDDLMAHWLQKLADRQVVVILDICHSGGFVADAKSTKGVEKAPDFDFLEREIGRLKDLGQGNEALLAACRSAEKSQVRVQHDFSVMTRALIEAVAKTESTLTLDDAFVACRRGVRDYFVELNDILIRNGRPARPVQNPVLVNHCLKMPVLRP